MQYFLTVIMVYVVREYLIFNIVHTKLRSVVGVVSETHV